MGVDNPAGLMVYVGETMTEKPLPDTEFFSAEFTRFVKEVEPRLSYAFFAAYGAEIAADVTCESLAYAWEHWDRIRGMGNPGGYLYRVGQSKARWYHRPRAYFPSVVRRHQHLDTASQADRVRRDLRFGRGLRSRVGPGGSADCRSADF